MDLTVQGGQSPASYIESAADWPPPIARVSRKPKVAQFCTAPWPNLTPSLTVSAIIQRAGLSRGMIHLHFGGKDGLLAAAAEAFSDEYYKEMDRQLAQVSGAPADVIMAVVRADLGPEILNQHSAAVWHAFRSETRTNAAIARYSDTRDKRLRNLMFKAFDGLIRHNSTPDDPNAADEITLGTLALLEGMWTDYMTHPDDFDRETAVKIVLRFLRGVVPGAF